VQKPFIANLYAYKAYCQFTNLPKYAIFIIFFITFTSFYKICLHILLVIF
jgi:hypothetical protein